MEDMPLRVTDTNSAREFSGLILGIEVPLFRWIILSLVVGLGLFSLLQSIEEMQTETKALVALAPAAITTCFVLLFCQGKPSGYFLDCLEAWCGGGDASPLSQIRSHYDDESIS